MFRVPEQNRLITHPILGSTSAAGPNGAFDLPSPKNGWRLAVIASNDEGWEHVSVHCYATGNKQRMRTPSWAEMCFVKDIFWEAEDEVVQFHPRRSEYVNLHPHTLHLWRALDERMPRPPQNMI